MGGLYGVVSSVGLERMIVVHQVTSSNLVQHPKMGCYSVSGSGEHCKCFVIVTRVVRPHHIPQKTMEVVRMDEETVLKTVGCNSFGGSIPFASANGLLV